MRDEDGGSLRAEAGPLHEALEDGRDRVRVRHHCGSDARQRRDEWRDRTRGFDE